MRIFYTFLVFTGISLAIEVLLVIFYFIIRGIMCNDISEDLPYGFEDAFENAFNMIGMIFIVCLMISASIGGTLGIKYLLGKIWS